jgi:hypothetical protein
VGMLYVLVYSVGENRLLQGQLACFGMSHIKINFMWAVGMICFVIIKGSIQM